LQKAKTGIFAAIDPEEKGRCGIAATMSDYSVGDGDAR
jgi:hypothetical protein